MKFSVKLNQGCVFSKCEIPFWNVGKLWLMFHFSNLSHFLGWTYPTWLETWKVIWRDIDTNHTTLYVTPLYYSVLSSTFLLTSSLAWISSAVAHSCIIPTVKCITIACGCEYAWQTGCNIEKECHISTFLSSGWFDRGDRHSFLFIWCFPPIPLSLTLCNPHPGC